MSRYASVLTWGLICALVLCTNLLISKSYGLAESTAKGGSNVQAVHELGETGEDVNVGLIAGRNILTTHEAFYDKDVNGNPVGSTHAFNYDFSGDGIAPINHDTWMAGIVASRGGVLYPDDKGVAPGSDIHCARVVDDGDGISFYWLRDALDELVTGQNCRVIVTGFALGPDPNGQSDWTLLYDYYAYHYNVIFANAAGNSDTQVDVFGDAYNGITTGGLRVTEGDEYGRVGSISGSGPTSDGRRKPDVVAPSQNQTMPSGGGDTSWYTWTSAGGHTSLSGPHTAGVAALLLQYADGTTDEANDGHNEVIKAVIVNSTFPNILDRAGAPTNPADPNNVWHEQRGYGRIDALRAYELLSSDRITPGVSIITAHKGWAYKTMTETPPAEDYFYISGEKDERFVLTVTWNRKVTESGGIYSAESPVWNFDLEVKDSNGNVLFEKVDALNNLEKVDIPLPQDDIYEVVVKKDMFGKDRSYALAFELLPPIPGDFDLNYIVDYNDLAYITGNWLRTGSGFAEDLFQDEVINSKDFSVFAGNWLNIIPAYYSQ